MPKDTPPHHIKIEGRRRAWASQKRPIPLMSAIFVVCPLRVDILREWRSTVGSRSSRRTTPFFQVVPWSGTGSCTAKALRLHNRALYLHNRAFFEHFRSNGKTVSPASRDDSVELLRVPRYMVPIFLMGGLSCDGQFNSERFRRDMFSRTDHCLPRCPSSAAGCKRLSTANINCPQWKGAGVLLATVLCRHLAHLK